MPAVFVVGLPNAYNAHACIRAVAPHIPEIGPDALHYKGVALVLNNAANDIMGSKGRFGLGGYDIHTYVTKGACDLTHTASVSDTDIPDNY